MIFAFIYVDGHRDPGAWIPRGFFPDEKALAPEPDGEYAVYECTEKTVDEGPEVQTPLPQGLKFKRRITNHTPPAPEAKIKAAK